jgi:hypothetical protein
MNSEAVGLFLECLWHLERIGAVKQPPPIPPEMIPEVRVTQGMLEEASMHLCPTNDDEIPPDPLEPYPRENIYPRFPSARRPSWYPPYRMKYVRVVGLGPDGEPNPALSDVLTKLCNLDPRWNEWACYWARRQLLARIHGLMSRPGTAPKQPVSPPDPNFPEAPPAPEAA